MAKVPTKRIVVRVFSPDGSRVVIGDGTSDLTLSIEFGCSMTTKPQRNAGMLTITNLSSTTRNALSKAANTELGLFEQAIFIADTTVIAGTGAPQTRQSNETLENGHAYCTIDAGEDGDVGRIFEGSVESISSRQNGPDWLTEIAISDGQATAGVEIDERWPAGVQLFDVINQIIKQMGLEPGNFTRAQLLNAIGANVKSVFARPFVIKRSADSILTEIFTLSNAEWWVDRGQFYIVRRAQPLVDRALLLTNEQGGLRSPPEQLDKAAIAIASDFRRGLRIGRKVVIQLDGVRTEYRADQVDHRLHTREGDFGSAALLRLIPKAV